MMLCPAALEAVGTQDDFGFAFGCEARLRNAAPSGMLHLLSLSTLGTSKDLGTSLVFDTYAAKN